MTSYGDMNFNQHWLSLWLNASRHHTTTRTNIDFSSHVFFGINIRANPQEVFRSYVFMSSTILLRGQWVNRDTIIYICLRVNNVLTIRVGKRGSCGPFNWHGSTLMQTWISNCRHYFVGDEILIHSQTSTVANWSLRMDKQFHSTSYWPCDYLSMLELKLILLVKQVHGCDNCWRRIKS